MNFRHLRRAALIAPILVVVVAWTAAQQPTPGDGSKTPDDKPPAERKTIVFPNGTWAEVKSESPFKREPRTHRSAIIAIGFSKDGKRVHSANAKGYLQTWDRESGTLLRSFLIGGDEDGQGVRQAVFSRDGRFAVAKHGLDSDRGEPTAWDVERGRKLAVLELGHPDQRVVDFDFSGDGRLLVGAGCDSTSLPGRTNKGREVEFSYSGFVRLWDTSTWKLAATIVEAEANEMFRGATFSPDGKQIMTFGGVKKDQLRIWDVASKKEIHSLSVDGGQRRLAWFLPAPGLLLLCPGKPEELDKDGIERAQVLELATGKILKEWPERGCG